MNNDEKNIEIVSGNGDDLNISPVYDNLDIAKPTLQTVNPDRCCTKQRK